MLVDLLLILDLVFGIDLSSTAAVAKFHGIQSALCFVQVMLSKEDLLKQISEQYSGEELQQLLSRNNLFCLLLCRNRCTRRKNYC